jgi:hypothetical protein
MPELLDEHGNPVNPQSSDSSGETAASAEQPNYAKSDDVAALREQLSGMTESLAELRGALSSAYQQQAPRQAPVEEPEMTDEEINRALQEGENPAAKLRAMLSRATRAAEGRVRSELEQLRNTGVSSLTEIVAGQAAALPHYKDYEKEIRGYMAQLPPEAQANFGTWKLAHDAVVGQHKDEIVSREIEAERRRSRDAAANPNLPGSGQQAAGGGTEQKVPQVEDWGGAEARSELHSKGQTEDEFAKKLGYKSWNDYMEKFQQTVQNEAERDDGMVQIPAWAQRH